MQTSLMDVLSRSVDLNFPDVWVRLSRLERGEEEMVEHRRCLHLSQWRRGRSVTRFPVHCPVFETNLFEFPLTYSLLGSDLNPYSS